MTPFASDRDASGGEPLRIAYLLSRYPAVSHTFFLKEVLGLKERGMTVEVASVNRPDRAMDALCGDELKEARLTYYIKDGSWIGLAFRLIAIMFSHPVVTARGLLEALTLGGWDLRQRTYALLYLCEALLVGDWMRRRSLCHLHVHFGGATAAVGLLASAAWEIPWSLTLHGPNEFFDQNQLFLERKIQSASFLFCVSDYGRSQVLRVAPALDPNRVEVLRLGVDCRQLQPRHFPDAAADDGLEPEPVHLVCTGRLAAEKGHLLLLDAVAQLAGLGFPVDLVLIGDGPERRTLEERSRGNGLAGRVSFAGSLSHAETLARVAEADIFVLASFAEGLPVALMEAMALGVVCVSTCVNGIPELIVDEENGLLVCAGNPGELSAALARLAADAGLRHTLGMAGRRTVEADYNLSTNIDLLAKAFRRRMLTKPAPQRVLEEAVQP
jgi:colanic acid/amylovoran biosynthesis glycosyltransferase